jgi:hypothetical protein
MCHHLHDSTSRYDAKQKVLTLLLVCRVCGTQTVVETVEYEPTPVWAARHSVPAEIRNRDGLARPPLVACLPLQLDDRGASPMQFDRHAEQAMGVNRYGE